MNNESWRLLERYGYEVEGLFCRCNFPMEPSGGGRLLVGHNFLNGEKLHFNYKYISSKGLQRIVFFGAQSARKLLEDFFEQ